MEELFSANFYMTVIAILIVAVVIFVFRSIIIMVPQGYNYTVERFGRYEKTLQPGFALLVPIFQSIGSKVNMKERVLEIHPQTIISKENATVKVDAICYVKVQDAVKAAYEIENADLAIKNITMTNIRSVLGLMEIDEMLSNREVINQKLLVSLDHATGKWGIKVNRVEIKEITPAPELIEVMNNQTIAERNKRKEILDAEGIRQATILTAQGQKESAVLTAEAQKQVQVLEAEAAKQAAFLQAEAKERLAEAEANAIKMVSEQIKNGDVNTIKYFTAIKYVESLGKIGESDSSKILMLPADASGLAGTVAALTEITKTVKQ